jgi:hypothetical protein
MTTANTDSVRVHLAKVTDQATRIRADLEPLLDAHGDRVHFRPSSTGIAMVGLLPSRPQRGRSGIRNLPMLVANFEAEFAANCRDIEQGRPTPEKALQSFLIRTAQTHQRRLVPLNDASRATQTPVELLFVTDEIALPDGNGGRVVCDLLALRVDGNRMVPVAIELKSARAMARLVEQVGAYADSFDDNADAFADLFAALLGRPVAFTGPCERWIVWKTAGATTDPREPAFASHHIRLVGYTPSGDDFAFRVGAAP